MKKMKDRISKEKTSKNNCCPFEKKSHLDKTIEIGVHGLGKGRRNKISMKEDEEITED